MRKKYPVYYLPPAEKDLEAIFDYIKRDSPSQAASFLKKIDYSIGRLERSPLSGTIPRDIYLKNKNYRILTIGNYLVFYRFEKKTVFIYRILHGKRRYEFLF